MTATKTLNQALQRIAPAVTPPASSLRFSPTTQGPRHVDERSRAHPSGSLRQSISLRSVPRSLSFRSFARLKT
jgi:hypothetical protein